MCNSCTLRWCALYAVILLVYSTNNEKQGQIRHTRPPIHPSPRKPTCTTVHQAGDAILEALAERNLADTREAHEDLPGALAHLRRCRALAQRSRNSALEADACRRLSSVYAEIAGQSGGGGGGNHGGGGGGRTPERENDRDAGDGGADGGSGTQERNRSDSGSPEPEVSFVVFPDSHFRTTETQSISITVRDQAEQLVFVHPPVPPCNLNSGRMLKRCCYYHAQIEIEDREDNDLEFLKSTAADRARLFAERYEATVFGLEWPVSSGNSGELAGEGLADDDGGGAGGGEPGDRRRSSVDSGGDRIAEEAAAAVPVAPVA